MPLPEEIDTSQIDTSRPHPARIYDYLLGGEDHFGVDAQTAEQAMLAIPTAQVPARCPPRSGSSARSPGNRDRAAAGNVTGVGWLAAVTEAAGGSSAALAAAAARARSDPGSCAVVLVEGMSDQAALETLAGRRGHDLRGEGVFVVPMGGATNIGHFLGLFGPRGFGVRLAGLCDEGEERDFRRGLERAGLGAPRDRAGLAGLGFFVCVADLEDELIRSLGVRRVEDLIEAAGELGPFRTFTRQPAQRGRPREQQLRRFTGTRSGRKIRYGHLLAAALDLARIPGPLAGVLARV